CSYNTECNVDVCHVYGAVLGNVVGHGHVDDFISAQVGHTAELAAVCHVNSAEAVARRQHTVEGAGRTSALHMAQYHGSTFESGESFDFSRQHIRYATKAGVSEFVFAQVHDNVRAMLRVDVGRKLRTFGYH